MVFLLYPSKYFRFKVCCGQLARSVPDRLVYLVVDRLYWLCVTAGGPAWKAHQRIAQGIRGPASVHAPLHTPPNVHSPHHRPGRECVVRDHARKSGVHKESLRQPLKADVGVRSSTTHGPGRLGGGCAAEGTGGVSAGLKLHDFSRSGHAGLLRPSSSIALS